MRAVEARVTCDSATVSTLPDRRETSAGERIIDGFVERPVGAEDRAVVAELRAVRESEDNAETVVAPSLHTSSKG